jgi:hypothetical protein
MKGLWLAVAVGSLLLGACATKAARGPEQLRSAYAEALRRDDPDAAYDLLSAQAQSQMSREAFSERWRSNAKERERQLAGMKKLDADLQKPVMAGVTTHEGGRLLHWAHVDGRWLVVDGLPGTYDTSTPASTIRGFVRALRTMDFSGIATLVDPELAAQLREDWTSRAERIERALAEPDRLDLSLDLSRAVLRYGQTEQITLEQSERGWRIIDFD